MAEPFLGEIRLVSFHYATTGWARCNGQQMPINQNQALFALLGTQFGGNGQTTFALPDLRGRMAIHRGNGHNIGEAGGSVDVILNQSQLPSHAHYVNMSNAMATSANPAGAVIGKKGRFGRDLFAGTPNTTMSVVSTTAGGADAHTNVQPYLGVTAMIALSGIFPSQN